MADVGRAPDRLSRRAARRRPDRETPAATDTRGITIAAPPEAVWPWLLQMGYGRAGWYSYDRLDMKGTSADQILPEHQALAVGDIVPTDPAGGFEVKVLEPGRTLVLYVDTALVTARATAMRDGTAETTPAGLAASGKFLETAVPPDFSVSWTFHLRAERDGGTRLIERMRLRAGEGTGATKVLAPVMGFGNLRDDAAPDGRHPRARGAQPGAARGRACDPPRSWLRT